MHARETLSAVRILRGVLWGLFALVVMFFWIVPAYAETIAATSNNGLYQPVRWVASGYTGCNSPQNFQTPLECANYLAGGSRTLKAGYPTTFSDGSVYHYSYNPDSASYDVFPTCPGGTTYTKVANTFPTCQGAVTYSCPANQNWTLSGSNCTRPDCSAGQTHSSTDGICRTGCAAAGTKGTGTAAYGLDKMGTGAMPSSLCIDGCSFDTKGLGVGLGADGSGGWMLTVGKSLGTSCATNTNGTNGTASQNATPAQQATDTVSKCVASGQGWGTVNGVTVCSGTPGVTQEKTVSTVQNTPASGAASTTETTTTTTCQGGTCTTTQSSKITSGGAGPGGTGAGSTTTNGAGSSTEQDQSTFCDQNPTSDKCQQQEAGPAATVSDLYTKGTKTVADVVGTFKTTVQGAGFYQAAANYFSASIPSGSCSGMSVDVSPPLGAAWHIDLGNYLCGSTAAGLYALLGIGVMLAAGWVAFRIAIL